MTTVIISGYGVCQNQSVQPKIRLHLVIEVALLSTYLEHNAAGQLGYLLQEGHTQTQSPVLHSLHLHKQTQSAYV